MGRSHVQSAYDELLVLAWQHGFPAAAEQLIRRWQPRLWRHARLLTDSSEDATEAVQASWASMVRNRKSLADPGRFGPWAYRIVTRRCADMVRQRRRARQSMNGALDTAESRDRPPSDLTEPLQAALAELSGDERALLTLAHVDDMPLRYIAEIFDIPVGTAKSRLHNLRARLRAKIEADTEVPERITP
ncbi:MAG: sigma-70 family RNA polymerase sigma factor [Planctomycetota bacterium]